MARREGSPITVRLGGIALREQSHLLRHISRQPLTNLCVSFDAIVKVIAAVHVALVEKTILNAQMFVASAGVPVVQTPHQ